MAEESKAEIRDLLLRCREKLLYYRDAHGGSYVGGVEFTHLDDRLAKMIVALATDETRTCTGCNSNPCICAELGRSQEALPVQHAQTFQFNGQVFPEQPMTPPGPDHRWHFDGAGYKCWDCPATIIFPQNQPENRGDEPQGD